MARPKTTIHAEVAPITGGGTEADMMCWVRVTEMLLRAWARREARLAAATVVRRAVLTISFSVAEPSLSRPLAAAV